MPPMPLVLPEISDDSILARYGFLPQSKEYIKKLLDENDITIEQLIDAPWLEDIRARGRIRLVESIAHKGDIKSAEIDMVPKVTQKCNEEESELVLNLLDALEDNDDVNKLYTNFEHS